MTGQIGFDWLTGGRVPPKSLFNAWGSIDDARWIQCLGSFIPLNSLRHTPAILMGITFCDASHGLWQLKKQLHLMANIPATFWESLSTIPFNPLFQFSRMNLNERQITAGDCSRHDQGILYVSVYWGKVIQFEEYLPTYSYASRVSDLLLITCH
jgi:hypothetical protein